MYAFLNLIPSRELTYPTLGKGYVSSLEGSGFMRYDHDVNNPRVDIRDYVGGSKSDVHPSQADARSCTYSMLQI